MPFEQPIPVPRKANPLGVFEYPEANIQAAREKARQNLAKQKKSATDLLGTFARGVSGGIRSLVDVVPDAIAEPLNLGLLSDALRENEGFTSHASSDVYKAQQAQKQAEREALGPDASMLDRGILAGRQAIEDPFETVAQTAGNLAPMALGGALGLSGRAGAGILSGLMGGGAVRGGIEDAILSASESDLLNDPRYRELRGQLPQIEARTALANERSSYEEAGGKIAAGGATGILSGLLGAESKILDLSRGVIPQAARTGILGAAKNVGLGALGEAATEFPEEGAQQLLSNLGASEGGATIDPFEGVIESAVQAGLSGAIGGGAAHGPSQISAMFGNDLPARTAPSVVPAEENVDEVRPKDPVNDLVYADNVEQAQEDIGQDELTPEQVANMSVGTTIDPTDFVSTDVVAGPESPPVVENDVAVPVEPSAAESADALAEQQPSDEDARQGSEQEVGNEVEIQGSEPVVKPEAGVEAGLVAEDSPVSAVDSSALPIAPEAGRTEVVAPSDIRISVADVPKEKGSGVDNPQGDGLIGEALPTSVGTEEGVVKTGDTSHSQNLPRPAESVNKIRGGDRISFEGRQGTVNSHPFKGKVKVSFDDGSVALVPVKSAEKIGSIDQPIEQAISEMRRSIPENAPNLAEFDAAVKAFESDRSKANYDALGREFSKALGRPAFARDEAFGMAVEALNAKEDPVQKLMDRGLSESSAKNLAKRARAFLSKKQGLQEPDLESLLNQSLDKPDFSRDVVDKTFADARDSFDQEMAQRFGEDLETYRSRNTRYEEEPEIGPVDVARNAFRRAKNFIKTSVQKVSDKLGDARSLTEEEYANYNGVKDSDRPKKYDEAVRGSRPVAGTKFKVVDFENDVDTSVLKTLGSIGKPLADAISSVSARIATAAGLPKDSFAGFGASGNWAGLRMGEKFYINPLKHLASSDSRRIASGIAKTIVHEMAHTNGISDHGPEFQQEVARITKAIESLIPGIERELSKVFSNDAIKQYKSLYEKAEGGWRDGRRKGRDVVRRRPDSAVPGVQPANRSASGSSPPDSRTQSEISPGKSEAKQTEKLGTDSKPEGTEGSPAEFEQSDLLDFSREAEQEIELPKQTDMQKLTAEFVNKYNRIGQARDVVEAVTGKKADLDLEEAAIAVSPQTASKIKGLKDYHVTPLLKLLGENGISISQADKYFWHKANSYFENDESRVEESKKFVRDIESGDKAEAYKAADEAFHRIIDLGRSASSKSSLGIDELGKNVEGPAEGLLQRAVTVTQKRFVKAAENVFRRQFAKFVASNPSSEWAINPKNMVGGHTVSFFDNGKKQRIWFKDPVLGKQVENLSDGETSAFMSNVRKVTNSFAKLNTRYNPVFPFKNIIRDLFFGLGKVYVDDGPQMVRKVLGNFGPAVIAMRSYLKDPEAARKTEWGKLAHLMREAGGIPAWFGLPDDKDMRVELEREIKEFDGSRGMGYKAFKRFWNGLGMLSEISESATRLAYMKELLDTSRLPIQEAIKKTRGVTGDFQRHGTNKNMRYAYAFFNSSIQGAAAMYKLTKELKDGNPRARNLFMFLASVGAAQVALGMAAGDDDNDGTNDYDQIPEYRKNSNLIIPIPGSKSSIDIPLPYGLNVPIVFGNGLARSLKTNGKDAGVAATNLVQSVMKSFNPMGDDASLIQMLSPTIADPVAQAAENKDSLGRKIHRDRYRGEEGLPDAAIISKKDSEWAKKAAEFLNDWSGGSAVKSGLFDVHPAVIDNTISWLTGSTGRFIKDTGILTPLGIESTKVPFVEDFIKTPKSHFYAGRFWDQLEELRQLKGKTAQLQENAKKEQLEGLGLDAEFMSRSDVNKLIPELSRDESDRITKEIEAISGKRMKLLPMYEEIRKQITAIQKSGKEDAAERIEELVKKANRKYEETVNGR